MALACFWCTKLFPHEPVLQQLRDPDAVHDIRLPPRHLRDLRGIGEDARERILAHIEDRFPVDPVLKLATWVTPYASSRSRNARSSGAVVPKVRTCWSRPPGPPGTRDHGLLVDVQSAAPLDHTLHGVTSAAMVRRHPQERPDHDCARRARRQQCGVPEAPTSILSRTRDTKPTRRVRARGAPG